MSSFQTLGNEVMYKKLQIQNELKKKVKQKSFKLVHGLTNPPNNFVGPCAKHPVLSIWNGYKREFSDMDDIVKKKKQDSVLLDFFW